jgi:hypothetical protein
MGIANTKERRTFRHQFVSKYLDTIAELITLWDKDSSRLGHWFKPKKTHPVRVWVESIREEAGYSQGLAWRAIWATLCSDYDELKKQGGNNATIQAA